MTFFSGTYNLHWLIRVYTGFLTFWNKINLNVCSTFPRFKTFIQSNEPRELLSEAEYSELAKKINDKKKKQQKKEDDAEEEEEEEEETGVIAPEDKTKAQNKIIEKHVS